MSLEKEFSLQLVAGKAFGSGAHPSTQAVLLALRHLHSAHQFHHALDMGCGSGVLSLAVAKLWDARVLAADINPESQAAVAENARLNGLENSIEFVRSDGFRHPRVKEAAPYDLLVCNMLAEHIIALSRSVASAQVAGGVLVLSGILQYLAPQVVQAYTLSGYRLEAEFAVADWRALVMVRS